MAKILDWLYELLWGTPMLLLMLGVGVWLTVCTHFVQLRLFPQAMRRFLRRDAPSGGVSPFRALCTALAATVGTGNLVGVAGAICLGGPGAVFWMLFFAFFGTAVKFAEATLAVRFRQRQDGEIVGGPMYMIRAQLPRVFLPLAYAYSACGVLASFGVGNLTQVNAIVTGVQSIRPELSPIALGLGLTALVGFAFWKGADSIGSVAERLVPYAASIYFALCLIFLTCRSSLIPKAFHDIFTGAFSPKAITGGLIGSAVRVVQVGCSRGVFTHEAGMGTASIAHASAAVDHPVEQGMMGLLEVFLDTFVICTMTALVILCSGVPVTYGTDAGAALTVSAFSAVYGSFGKVIVAAFLACFAYATILGWSLYGLRCAQFLFGRRAAPVFFVFQTAAVTLGAVLKTPMVWRMAEIVNGLMAIPNLVALCFLSPELRRLTNSYTREISRR